LILYSHRRIKSRPRKESKCMPELLLLRFWNRSLKNRPKRKLSFKKIRKNCKKFTKTISLMSFTRKFNNL